MSDDYADLPESVFPAIAGEATVPLDGGDYADLRALAETYLAVPGPAYSQTRHWYSVANPARILALLADLNAARSLGERIALAIEVWRDTAPSLTAEDRARDKGLTEAARLARETS